jgi:transcriptional regulator with XRE-family HTH domain
MKKTLIEQYVEDPNRMRVFLQERAILEVTELIEAVMKEQGISRKALADRLGKTKSWVSQMLDGEANKTIRTVADTFAVLGREYHSSQRPIRIGRASASGQSPPVQSAKSPLARQKLARPEDRYILSLPSGSAATQAEVMQTAVL